MNTLETVDLQRRVVKLEALAEIQTSINESQTRLIQQLITVTLRKKVWPDEEAH